MIRVPYAAAPHDLDALLDGLTPYYHLYIAEVTVDPGVTLADFAEADWPTYTPRRAVSWVPAIMSGGRAVATADPIMWQRGTGGSPRQVYGYFVTDGQTGPLCWWEPRDAGPLPMAASGDSVIVRPRLTLREDAEPES